MADGGSVIIPKDEVHRFVIRCMGTVGLEVKHSTVLADLITSADYRGHASHGLNKLGKFTLH
jgi:LDH2 family malate/lactate/ureidoglycolate dehydrogenase